MSTSELVGADGRLTHLRGHEVASVLVDGRPTFEKIEGTDFEIEAELVLLALGFVGPEKGTIVDQLGVETDERGNVARSTGWATSVDSVFACGDMGRGQSLIVWAIAEGRSCAAAVDASLMGSTLLPAPVKPTDRPLM